MSMIDFITYTVIDETELAVKIKVPYWDKDNRPVQKYAILWMPKAIEHATNYVTEKLKQKGLEHFVFGIVSDQNNQKKA